MEGALAGFALFVVILVVLVYLSAPPDPPRD